MPTFRTPLPALSSHTCRVAVLPVSPHFLRSLRHTRLHGSFIWVPFVPTLRFAVPHAPRFYRYSVDTVTVLRTSRILPRVLHTFPPRTPPPHDLTHTVTPCASHCTPHHTTTYYPFTSFTFTRFTTHHHAAFAHYATTTHPATFSIYSYVLHWVTTLPPTYRTFSLRLRLHTHATPHAPPLHHVWACCRSFTLFVPSFAFFSLPLPFHVLVATVDSIPFRCHSRIPVLPIAVLLHH